VAIDRDVIGGSGGKRRSPRQGVGNKGEVTESGSAEVRGTSGKLIRDSEREGERRGGKTGEEREKERECIKCRERERKEKKKMGFAVAEFCGHACG
jgi:hypothetical protein